MVLRIATVLVRPLAKGATILNPVVMSSTCAPLMSILEILVPNGSQSLTRLTTGALIIRYSSNDGRADSAILPTIPPQLPLAPVGAYGRCRMDPSYALIGSLRSPVVQTASFQRGLSLPAAARCSKWTWQSSEHHRAWSLIRRLRHHHLQKLRQPHQQ